MPPRKPVSPRSGEVVESIARLKRAAREKPYDPQPLLARLQTLMDERNLSMRFTAMQAGLDHQANRRIQVGERPDMVSCILMADLFEVNPNEFLQLGGWPTLKVFDIKSVRVDNLPPEAVDVALDIAKIPDPGTRKQVAEAVRVLLKKYFTE
jgi:hypothetical protein